LKKKAEEKAMQSIPAVQNPELSQQERQKVKFFFSYCIHIESIFY
jgi:hypothetical protein